MNEHYQRYNIEDSQVKISNLAFPKYTWRCEVSKMFHYHVEEGKQPNAFHRFMQRLCLGFKWERIGND